MVRLNLKRAKWNSRAGTSICFYLHNWFAKCFVQWQRWFSFKRMPFSCRNDALWIRSCLKGETSVLHRFPGVRRGKAVAGRAGCRPRAMCEKMHRKGIETMLRRTRKSSSLTVQIRMALGKLDNFATPRRQRYRWFGGA
jgi:hypothetical protein